MRPVPIFAIKSSFVSLPSDNCKLPLLGDGADPTPREALAVLFISSCFAVLRSNVQPSRIPFFMTWRGFANNPSASKGLEPAIDFLLGSSKSDRFEGKICSPR